MALYYPPVCLCNHQKQDYMNQEIHKRHSDAHNIGRSIGPRSEATLSCSKKCYQEPVDIKLNQKSVNHSFGDNTSVESVLFGLNQIRNKCDNHLRQKELTNAVDNGLNKFQSPIVNLPVESRRTLVPIRNRKTCFTEKNNNCSFGDNCVPQYEQFEGCQKDCPPGVCNTRKRGIYSCGEVQCHKKTLESTERLDWKDLAQTGERIERPQWNNHPYIFDCLSVGRFGHSNNLSSCQDLFDNQTKRKQKI